MEHFLFDMKFLSHFHCFSTLWIINQSTPTKNCASAFWQASKGGTHPYYSIYTKFHWFHHIIRNLAAGWANKLAVVIP